MKNAIHSLRDRIAHGAQSIFRMSLGLLLVLQGLLILGDLSSVVAFDAMPAGPARFAGLVLMLAGLALTAGIQVRLMLAVGALYLISCLDFRLLGEQGVWVLWSEHVGELGMLGGIYLYFLQLDPSPIIPYSFKPADGSSTNSFES